MANLATVAALILVLLFLFGLACIADGLAARAAGDADEWGADA